jgi:outer membrane receptor protein involved in Fe transport
MRAPADRAAALVLAALLTAAPPSIASEPAAESDQEPAAAAAREAVADVPDKVWHDELIVTATRAPSEAGSIPLYSSVLEARQILAAPDSGALELLRQVTSLNVARDTSNLVAQPRDQAISFRGLVGSVQSRALPLVDGLPITDPYGGWVTFSVVPKELIERVEVVRGGGSSAWGNLALSGVVNLITRAPSEREIGATLRAGERATGDATLFYTDAGERWRGWLAGNHFETDGYVTVAPEDRGAVDEAKFRRYDSLHGRLGYSASDRTLWTARALYYDERRGLGLETDRDDASELAFSATLDHQRPGGDAWQGQLFHRELRNSGTSGLIDEERATVEPESAIVAQPSRSTGVGVSWSAERGRHRFTLGGDYLDNAIERSEHVGWDGQAYTGRYDVRGSQRLGGFYLQDGVTLSERASLRLGARFDHVWSGDASSVRSALPSGVVTGSDPIEDHSETAFNPSLGLVVATSATTRVRGALYTGFRYGTPSELFVGSSGGGRSITVPNAELVPETLVGGEVGFDYTPSRRLALRLTSFRNEVEDLIQRILVGTTGATGGAVPPCGPLRPNSRCFQRQNLGEIRSTGFEIGADLRPSERWRWTLDATLMESRVTENPNDPALEGNQVERAPDQQIAAAVEYRHPRIGDLLLRGRYASRAYDDAENTELLPSHTLVDVGWSRALGDRWQLYAGVENLFETRYINRYSSDEREVNAPRLVHAGFRVRGGARD